MPVEHAAAAAMAGSGRVAARRGGGAPRLGACLAAVAALACQAAAAQDLGPSDSDPLAMTFGLGFERLRLPGGEGLGLAGATVLFDIGDGNWGAGPAVYGAATGRRGGLFVGGLQVERLWNWDNGYAATAGLFAGGGGGAAAPVGGGLMLRPSLALYRQIAPSTWLGLTWSSVRFPSGDISSRQVGISVSWAGLFRQAHADARPEPEASGLGFERISGTVSRDAFRDGGRRIGLLGLRAERGTGIAGLTWGLDAAAAAQGGAAGYMELLGSLAFSVPPWPALLPSWRVGVRTALGLGGGGAVPSGGGLMGRVAAGTEISPRSGWTLGIDAGVVRGSSSRRANYAEARLGVDLEPGAAAGSPGAGPTPTEWIASLQHHAGEPRNDGSRRALDTVGLTLNRYLGAHLYVSGQVHSAYAGGAGAFSIGLLGAGVASAGTPWRVGAELLAGAAGGGGVATGGGAIAQAMAWAGWRPSPRSEWRVGIGQRRSLHSHAGGSALAELSWSRSFVQ